MSPHRVVPRRVRTDDDAEDRDDVERRPDEELRERAGLVEEVLGLGERVEPVRKSTSESGAHVVVLTSR